jgi:Na+-driven multidrug efflux pump
MGVAGSGLGSSIATICEAIYYFLVSASPHYFRRYHFFGNLKIKPETIRSIFRISLPVSFQNVFILLGFLCFVAITGLIGIREQAATQAIISLLFMSFLPCYGFGIAVQTLVGNFIGEQNIISARFYGFQTVRIATVYTIFLGALFILFPQQLLTIITEDESIISVANPAMRIAGFAQIFYGIGIVLANGLQALGKTGYVMFAEVITNLFLLVPLSFLFGVVFRFGIVGAWSALPIYIICYSIIIFLKFRKAGWTEISQF